MNFYSFQKGLISVLSLLSPLLKRAYFGFKPPMYKTLETRATTGVRVLKNVFKPFKPLVKRYSQGGLKTTHPL